MKRVWDLIKRFLIMIVQPQSLLFGIVSYHIWISLHNVLLQSKLPILLISEYKLVDRV